MYGHRARIGYTSPPIVTEVFPYEFYKMAPPGVTLADRPVEAAARHHPLPSYNVLRRSRSEFAITDSEPRVIAAAAAMGLTSSPNAG